jgi:hypothetical protein
LGGEQNLDELRSKLIYEINLNGIYAMHRVARRAGKNAGGNHNTSYFDCVIGNRITSMALEIFEDQVPTIVYDFIINHHSHEVCHCCMGPSYTPSEFADKIASFHQKIMKEHGIVSYFACMPLLGERIALATAFFGRNEDDPHTTVTGFLDEFYHCTTPLILLASLDPTEEHLRLAISDQEEFLRMSGVTDEDRTFPRTRSNRSSYRMEYCTVRGRDEHNV